MDEWKLRYCAFEFEPRDCWIGVFWRKCDYEDVQGYPVPSHLDIWICLLPMVPLHLRFQEALEDVV